jgi:hypothetical protein
VAADAGQELDAHGRLATAAAAVTEGAGVAESFCDDTTLLSHSLRSSFFADAGMAAATAAVGGRAPSDASH